MKKLFLLILSFLLPFMSFAEDTEIYLGNASIGVQPRGKILIIFDNSGSMRTVESNVKPEYDPDGEYPPVGADNALSTDFIYFVKGTLDGTPPPVPGGPNEHRRFLKKINSCQVAKEALETKGIFTGYLKEYVFKGSSGSWQEIPDNDGANIEVIDCWEDVNRTRPENPGTGLKDEPIADGYPADALGTKKNPQTHTSDINDASPNLKAGELVTLYTDHYLRWYHQEDFVGQDESRLSIAQRTITNVIETTPSYDFGLMLFNFNAWNENERDGGRIIRRIEPTTPESQKELIDIINLEIDAETNTPLCETYYEAVRYFAGLSVQFGDDDTNAGNSYKANTPPMDASVASKGVYISPFEGCTDQVNVILITDGAPTVDSAANDEVLALPDYGIDDPLEYKDPDTDTSLPVPPGAFSVNNRDSYLPRLAWWARNNDINQNKDGEQYANLYTVGFGLANDSDESEMLDLAAQYGDGVYANANASDANDLGTKIREILNEISKRSTTFTAPSVASNNFDRTETLDSVYYAMFSPSRKTRWQGNLKKLKIARSGLIDRKGKLAIDEDGNIKASASTLWSNVSGDGPEVGKGGVASMFSAMDPEDRVLYSDLGSNGSIVDFTKANAISNNAYGSEDALATALKIDKDFIDEYLNWMRGYDVDLDNKDNTVDDMRDDVFGDPLHSRPLVVNYGGSKDDQDVRIIVGTNAGALHMFNDDGKDASKHDDDVITEKWAFMPKEFFGNVASLRSNISSAKDYGIDGTPVSYIYDSDGDGNIEPDSGDKVWVFFGLRRGGSSYYGIDISYKDKPPKLLWHINDSTEHFSELGQSWSTPKVVKSVINVENGKAKPVLVFGGGYDPAKDVAGIGEEDNSGRAIYMIDAETGKHLWSITADDADFAIKDSIPTPIATLDSDSDGYVDRLYAGDTGGFVWRVDLPGTDTSKWKPTLLASLGSESVEAEDLRFFAEPTIVRAIFEETFEFTETIDGESVTTVHRTQKPYDAILLGSGDRTSPLSSKTEDWLFMIKDENIITQTFETVPDKIIKTQLYDYTDNPFEGLEKGSQAFNDLAINVSMHKGWKLKLVGKEEKALTKPEAIAGVAYYSTFIPAAVQEDSCELDGGTSAVYAVDLALGVKIYDQRVINHTGTIQDVLTLISVPDPENPDDGDDDTTSPKSKELKLILGDAETLCDANGNCDGLRLKTMRTHLVIAEDNQ